MGGGVQDVTAAILQRNGKILIARRKQGRHAGKWEFPGGKVDAGETPEACLARELHEEFGIDVEVGAAFAESVYDYRHGTIRLLAYHVYWDGDELQPRDHDKFVWLPPAELPAYDLLPADLPLAEKLASNA